jgi:hypothetical protein
VSDRREDTPGARRHAKAGASEREARPDALIEDLQAANPVPADREDRARTDEQVTFRIFLAARQRLSTAADRQALQRLYEKIGAHLQADKPVEISRQLFNALDEAICEHARNIGMKIYLSRFVYPRISQWEDELNGAELHEKLGNALALNVRISRGQAKAPIDPRRLKIVRRELISEVKRLRALLKGRFPERALPNRDKILSVALELIATPSHRLMHLKANATAIRNFNVKDIQAGDEANPSLFDLFTGAVSPTVLVDALLGWSTVRSGEALRQMLSIKPSRKRS